jgi:K+ transporter
MGEDLTKAEAHTALGHLATRDIASAYQSIHRPCRDTEYFGSFALVDQSIHF